MESKVYQRVQDDAHNNIRKEILMNEQNGDGAFLIRFGAKKTFVISLKYTDRDREIRVADYQIKRTIKEDYR